MTPNPTTLENCATRLRELRCCVLIPTYNNDQSLQEVIESVKTYAGQHLLIVNDGSTDSTAQILAQYPDILQLSYEPNAGKGIAMRRGFKFLLERDYDFAITLDSDGQHYAKDLTTFVDALMKDKNTLYIGARNMGQENVPTKSSFGNKFSSFWLWVETGIRLSDTQSGYRLYPIRAISKLTFITRRYEFEVEVLARAAWAGLDLKCLPIDVYYPPAEERVSHFRPFWDFFRISVLNTFLCILAFIWYRPKLFFRRLKKKNLKQYLKEEFFRVQAPNSVKSAAVGYGLFWGIFPAWGFQLAIGLPTAALLRLPVPLVFLAANISIPPMIPFILYASFWTGALVLGGNQGDLSLSQMNNLDVIQTNIYQYSIGAVVLAIVAGIVGGLLSYLILQQLNSNKKTSE